MPGSGTGSDLHAALPDHITLYLTTPIDRTDRMLREILRCNGLTPCEPYPFVMAVPVDAGQLEQLCFKLGDTLSSTERQMTRCWMAVNGNEPTPAQLMHAQTLDDLTAWIDSQWLGDLLQQQRLVTYFQPIVDSRIPSNVFAYECLLRGCRDGQTIPPDRLYGAARATGMLPDLDSAARLTAIRSAAAVHLETSVFINFNPRSIDTPQRCLRTTLDAARQCNFPPERMVFEVVESEEIVEPEKLRAILDFYRSEGYRVALDDIGAGYSSLHLLSTLKPDFIKLDMSLIRNVDHDAYKSCVAAKVLELARELGVRTVVEGVETIGEWEWAREHCADYAQGFLFARPRPKPPKSSFGGETGPSVPAMA